MTHAKPLAWIGDTYEIHCLVLARALTGRELLMRLGGGPGEMFVPQDEDEANEFLWAGMEDYWSWGAARAGEAGSWAFSLEPASIWGSISARLERASRGTEAICCFTADGIEFVEYWQDGELVTAVDTSAPQDRANKGGTDPYFLVEQMQRAGLLAANTPAQSHSGLDLLHEVTGVVLEHDRTMLGLSGKLPAEGRGPEKLTAESESLGAVAAGTGGAGGAVGGPVGEPSVPRATGLAKATGGLGAQTGS
ncbi:DUF6461 domain-containing protein [Streptomyces inhibens]|uniref:DUF6461 domain-containing protein n=1 Tax=Streptomyces inhibens TaxID=2293571 RepID=UPI00379595D1